MIHKIQEILDFFFVFYIKSLLIARNIKLIILKILKNKKDQEIILRIIVLIN